MGIIEFYCVQRLQGQKAKKGVGLICMELFFALYP